MKMNIKFDKPSYLSQRVLKVYRQNKTEETKLCEKLKKIEREQTQNMIMMREDITSLRNISKKIKDVKAEMDISKLRRRFFADNGYQLSSNKMNMDELVKRIDAVIHQPMRTPIPLIFKKTEVEDDKEDAKEEEYVTNLDIKPIEELDSGECKPYQFRKIVPPLKGRKMTSVYKGMKKEGKGSIKMREVEDFNKSEFEIQVDEKPQLKKGNCAETKKENDATLQCGDEIIRKTGNLKSAWDENGNVYHNIHKHEKEDLTMEGQKTEISSENNEYAKECMEHRIQRNHYSKRPLSCPADTMAKTFTVSPTLRKRANSSIKTYVERQPSIAWGLETANDQIKIDSKSTTKTKIITEMKGKQRPKSCQDKILGHRRNTCASPQYLKRISIFHSTDRDSHVRRVSYANGYEVEKEIVYDARPKDAMTSGYATVQMTVGKKSAAVHIPKFKKELQNRQIAGQKNANIKFEMERKRIERIRQTIKLQEF